MSTDLRPALKIETAQVLCVEIVAGPDAAPEDQAKSLEILNGVLRKSDAYRGAEATGKLRQLPRPGGIALVFSGTPDGPVRCAIQVAKGLRAHAGLSVRMGIYRGPVADLTELDDDAEPASGLRTAQRLMECGDAGHILMTRRLAESLSIYRHWQPHLEHLGECQTPDGEVISVVNLYTGEVGNPEMPSRIHFVPVAPQDAADRIVRWRILLAVLAAFALVLLLLSFGLPKFLRQDPAPVLASVEPEVAIPEKSIAVLPLENIAGTAESAMFTDGVHDEILGQLAKLSDLKVISRTSVLQYKTPRARNLREIARQLGVAHVLEGTVQQLENRVRVSVQLIDARTDAHLWAQTYDRVLADVFAIQTEIASTVTEQLKVRLTPREREALARAATTDLVAEKLFRQAWQHVTTGDNPDGKRNLHQAIRLLEEVVERDPQFMRAYQLLANSQLDLYWLGFDHTDARREAAREVVERAVRVNPNAGETHLTQAIFAYHGYRDYDRARAELELARNLLPNDPVIHVHAAAMDRRQGRWNEAERNFERTVQIDPRNYRFLVEAGLTSEARRHYPQASQFYERALAVTPGNPFARTQAAAVPFLEHGNLEPLQAELAAILKTDPTASTAVANTLFHVSLATRDLEGAKRAIHAIPQEGLRDFRNNSLWARDWFVGLAARTFGHEEAAQAAFAAARQVELDTVGSQPDYAPAWGRLGLIEAALGNKEAALQASRKACELLPVALDTLDGTNLRVHLAMTYLWVGEKELALAELEEITKLPASVHFGELARYPQWDALRGDARFEKIVNSLRAVDARP